MPGIGLQREDESLESRVRELEAQQARTLERLEGIEADLEGLSARWDQLWEAISGVREKLASLDGRLAGYLVAAALLGTVVAFIAQVVLKTKGG